MFLHHTMTDFEILRTCEGCESPHLRLVADRLRARVDDLQTIGTIAAGIIDSHDFGAIREGLKMIRETAIAPTPAESFGKWSTNLKA